MTNPFESDTRTPPNTPPNTPTGWVPAYPWVEQANDEIDLFELMAGLWRRRWFIVATTFAFLIAAVVWVEFIATPTYSVEARIRPPADTALVGLNKGTSFSATPAGALATFSAELQSRRLLLQTFNAIMASGTTIPWTGNPMAPGVTEQQVFLEDFLPRLEVAEKEVTAASGRPETFLLATFEAQDPEGGKSALETIINQANQAATKALRDSFQANLELNIAEKQRELDRILAQLADGRTDIYQVNSGVAQKSNDNGAPANEAAGVRYSSVSAQLQAEIAQLEVLSELPLENLSIIRIDLPPIAPTRPISPKKKLVVAAATVAGGMLAVLVALILNARDSRRSLKAESSAKS